MLMEKEPRYVYSRTQRKSKGLSWADYSNKLFVRPTCSLLLSDQMLRLTDPSPLVEDFPTAGLRCEFSYEYCMSKVEKLVF